jgi:hypothetical protein
MTMPCDLPRQVTIQVAPPSEGLAVSVTFEMWRKNHFTYTVFLGPDGVIELVGSDLLRSFDEDRALFLMDYDDPRSAFTGRIIAKVLTTSELERAVETFEVYRKYVSYPEGYEARLRASLARGQNPDEYRVEVRTA